jgi:hypothetical protein
MSNLLKITEIEIEFLSLLAYYNYLYFYKIQDKDTRWALLSSPKMKQEMRDYLRVSYQSFVNIYTNLRKKNVIKGFEIDERYVIIPQDGKFELTFNLIINEGQ